MVVQHRTAYWVRRCGRRLRGCGMHTSWRRFRAAICKCSSRRGRCKPCLGLPHRGSRRPCRQRRRSISRRGTRPGTAQTPRTSTPRRPTGDRCRPLDRSQRRWRLIVRVQRRRQLHPITDPAGPKDQRINPKFGADPRHRLGRRGGAEQLQVHVTTRSREAVRNLRCRSRNGSIRSCRSCECAHAEKSRSAPERRCWGGSARQSHGHGSGCRCSSAVPEIPRYSPPHRNWPAASA